MRRNRDVPASGTDEVEYNLLQRPSHAYLAGRANPRPVCITTSRFDRNHTVEPYITHRWPPDLSKTRARCGIGSTSAKLPKKSFGGPHHARFADPIVSLPPYQFARIRALFHRRLSRSLALP